MEWQMIGTDEWVYGRKVRGIVRVALAEVCFDEELDGPAGGWIWMVLRRSRGKALTLAGAIEAAENEMGIESDLVPCPNCQANLLDVGTYTLGACTFCNRCAAEVTKRLNVLGPQSGTAVTKRKNT